MKKKKGWPKYTHCDKVLYEIYDKDVGSIIIRKRTAVDDGYPFFLVTQVDANIPALCLVVGQ